MVKDLVAIENKLKAIDVTKLVEYTKKINDIGSLNKMLAPDYMRDFINAIDSTNIMLSNAIKCDLDAESTLDTAEAIAFLDNAGDYLKERGIKDSAEARKKYIDVDPDVIKAKNIKAKTTALVAFLKNKLSTFRMAHDDVKKITYTDHGMTQFEGY